METINIMFPRHRHRQNVILFVGYALVGCAIMLISIILLFIAFGFGYKNGQVIQSGLLFVSSTPRGAQIFIDGKKYKSNTNTRLILQAGTYGFSLSRSGYRDWRRSIDVTGGQVESFTYPFLISNSLTTSTRQDYAGLPSLMTESPDQRWLLVAHPGSFTDFDLYDLNNPRKAPAVFALPPTVMSTGASQSLQLTAWAGDNAHLLLKHTFDGKTEYVLANRSDVASSVNLTKDLGLPQGGIDLRLDDGKYDHYLALDSSSHTLSRASLATPTLQPYLTGVLAFDASGNDIILFATPDTTDTSKVSVSLYDGTNTYVLRHAPANTTYLLALSSYQGGLYASVSASSEGVAFIYQNPVSQIANQQLGVAVPVRVLTIKSPDSVSASPGGQYIVFEHGTDFAVYDAETQNKFAYSVPPVMDSPQSHATWMDGARLQYVSQGQLLIFDYDGQNRETIVSADAKYKPIYDANFKVLYLLITSASDKAHELLTSTPLRIPADQ